MYLLDTNVVSELRKPRPHGGVVEWVRTAPEEYLHVSVVTLGEIQAGIEITRRRDREKADEIERWLDDLAQSYNVLVVDALVSRRWAQLMHGKSDHHLEDGLIAATALAHDLSVVTRNTAGFESFGVRLINPFMKSTTDRS